ncbi:MAG: DUF3604 domain-containing protein [Lentisphaerae bacterium]|jgi:hypothetical protein|nr:DUF3604 domain-containing protein [Lentisphaerota bacterium]MBT5607431.1 DUF3604 domain-containing protein [Lentisphaerota bacterium]MBT7056139.1 DUF3604 domain-containing protein [Lentisphaerota bacterium]MBT7841377.1 DUF3604 domain-containing protein [Lentisphaerota bacterium]
MAPNPYGTFAMDPAGPFEAGGHTTVRFVYTVGSAGLACGGRLRIATPNQGWGEPLVLCPNPISELIRGPARRHNPWKPLNTTFELETQTDTWLRMWVEERHCLANLIPDGDGWEWAHRAVQWRWWIVADVECGDFVPGDRITIVYGNTDEDPLGVRVQPFPESPTRPFVCAVDTLGDGQLREPAGSPVYPDVISAPPERVNVVGPSLVTNGKPFTVKASVLDRNLTHPVPLYSGPVAFDLPQGVSTDDPPPPRREGDAHCLDDLRATEAGRYAIEATTDVGTAVSNPILAVPQQDVGLYWGDLHAQCMYHQWKTFEKRGDSNRTPAELHQYARECSLLDFVANTNSGCPGPSNPGWEETQQATIDFYEPGRYVTFKGWECGLGVQGDRCLIYREADVEPNFVIPRAGPDDPTNAHALLRFCRESDYRIITSNHSFMKYLDWSVFDPEIDRIVEIYSCWGSYEARVDNPLNSKRRPRNQSLRYMLGLGYTPGIVAAGDSHVGYPGRSLMASDPYMCQNWKAGLAAVYAPELTREAIWDALHQRHCYATTGVRIVLDFRLNEKRMGSILEYASDDERLAQRAINVSVHGTDAIQSIDVFKNNGLLRRTQPKSDVCEFSLTDRPNALPTSRDWYYVRVLQADGNAAWSSPIWIGPTDVTAPSESMGE